MPSDETIADAVASNIPYQATEISGASAELAPTGEAIEYTQAGEFDFVAYYPYSSDAGSGKLTVNLTDQNNQAAIDVLVARRKGVSASSSEPVSLAFSHALSKITINFKAGTVPQADVAQISEVTITGMPGTVAVSFGGGTSAGAAADIAMHKESAADGFDATFSAIVAPHAALAGRTIKATVGSETITWAIPASDVMETGSNYTYPATVDSGVKLGALWLGSSSITPWETISRDPLQEQESGDLGNVEPDALNARITWKDGRYALTTDPSDAGLYFKFGSVVGIFSASGALQTLPATSSDAFSESDVAWTPLSGPRTWASIPNYTADDYPMIVSAPSYHNVTNVRLGKGDPCRLVGLDLAAVAAGGTDIDNGLWRLPTVAENEALAATASWAQVTDINGVSVGDIFLPASGRRLDNGKLSAQGATGYYWASEAMNTETGSTMYFSKSETSGSDAQLFSSALCVRCVKQ